MTLDWVLFIDTEAATLYTLFYCKAAEIRKTSTLTGIFNFQLNRFPSTLLETNPNLSKLKKGVALWH
jgi:hypothetical protein